MDPFCSCREVLKVELLPPSDAAKLSRSYAIELEEYCEIFRGRKSERLGRAGDMMREPEPVDELPDGVIGRACGRFIDKGIVLFRLDCSS